MRRIEARIVRYNNTLDPVPDDLVEVFHSCCKIPQLLLIQELCLLYCSLKVLFQVIIIGTNSCLHAQLARLLNVSNVTKS